MKEDSRTSQSFIEANVSNVYHFVFQNDKLLVSEDFQVPIDNAMHIDPEDIKMQIKIFPGSNDHRATEVHQYFRPPSNMKFVSLIELHLHLEQGLIELAKRAFHLIVWHNNSQYCGTCGSRTFSNLQEHKRVCSNEQCRHNVFPRISPVVIVAVENGDQILLARSHGFPANIYSTLAGFVEAGETLEQSVHREVFEETGIKIKNLRYYGCQSWPFPDSLMIGFQAEYSSGSICCNPDEIEDAKFFHVGHLPETFPGQSTISQWLIRDFCNRMG